MTKMHRMNLIAAALILGGGVLQAANAQQGYDAPPAYVSDAAPQYQEPPLLLIPSQLPYLNHHARSKAVMTWRSADNAVVAEGSPGRLLMVHNNQGIRYVSGGVGEGERAELNGLSSEFNLRLLFAMQGSGEYLSSVQVMIQDGSGGTILSADSKGPWFLAQLPPGNYTVVVNVSGRDQPQRQTTHIKNSGQSRLDFYWR